MEQNNISKAWWISIILILLPTIVGIAIFVISDEWVHYLGLIIALSWLLGYGTASIATVEITERHVVLLFKKPIAVLPSGYGLYLRAPGILSAEVLPAGQIQFQFPGEDENTFKGSGNDPIPSGLAPNGLPWSQPYRITTADAKTAIYIEKITMAESKTKEMYEKDDLRFRLVAEPSYRVIWKIQEGEEVRFILNVGSIAEAFRRMRDEIADALQVEFSTRTPNMIIDTTDVINTQIRERLKRLMEHDANGEVGSDWGTDIISTGLLPVDMGQTVAQELQNKAKAEIAKQKTITDAEAQSEARKKEAEGEESYLNKTGDAKNRVLKEELENRAKHPEINRQEALKNAGWKTVVGDSSKFLVTHPTEKD